MLSSSIQENIRILPSPWWLRSPKQQVEGGKACVLENNMGTLTEESEPAECAPTLKGPNSVLGSHTTPLHAAQPKSFWPCPFSHQPEVGLGSLSVLPLSKFLLDNYPKADYGHLLCLWQVEHWALWKGGKDRGNESG